MVRAAKSILLCVLFTTVALFVAVSNSSARSVIRTGEGTVNLPYSVADGQGNQWMIYYGGFLQQQGNSPLYSQGAVLSINGSQPQQRNNRPTLDPKTNELVFDNLMFGSITLTRRILINKEEGYVRYVDILKNTQKQDQSLNIQLQTNLNYGVQTAQMVPDSRKKDQNIGWSAQTHAGRAVVEIFAGRGSKVCPTLTWPQGNSYIQASLAVTVPGNKEIALLHIHGAAASQDAGVQWINGVRESKLLATIPREYRRLIVNFAGGDSFVGDYEILRGDAMDVVELRTGDQVKGTLKDKIFKLETFYGNVELPVEKVIGLLNIGDFRPRQLLVTAQGEVFGGRLQQAVLSMELSSGQVTQIPLTQIARVGYRKRPGEPEEWTFEKPFVLMRSGDRVEIQMPTAPIEVVTRYGKLSLDPGTVASIMFQCEEHGVHEVRLKDGSHFAGLVAAEQFAMNLSSPSGQAQAVNFPAASVLRIQFAPGADDQDEEDAGQLDLINQDSLVGTVTGQLKLDTAFDTLTLNATEIKRLGHAKGSGTDVQIELWDQSSVSGQLQSQELDFKLKCGLLVKVPVTLIDQYAQPSPQPSATMLEKIKALVTQLNADEWKQREQAEEQLASMGPGVAGALRQLREGQTPEAQQRIDSILKKVDKDSPAESAPMPMTPMPMGM